MENTLYRNTRFFDDLSAGGQAVQSVEYRGGSVTVVFFRWTPRGEYVQRGSHTYHAREIPPSALAAKFTPAAGAT